MAEVGGKASLYITIQERFNLLGECIALEELFTPKPPKDIKNKLLVDVKSKLHYSKIHP